MSFYRIRLQRPDWPDGLGLLFVTAIVVAVIMLISSCGGSRHGPELRPVPRNPGLVEYWDVYSSWHTWKLTPWVRISQDMSKAGPFHIAVDTNGRACLLDPQTWTLVKENTVIDCPTPWRHPR